MANEKNNFKKEIIFGLVIMVTWWCLIFGYRYFYREKIKLSTLEIILIGFLMFLSYTGTYFLASLTKSRDKKRKKVAEILLIILLLVMNVLFWREVILIILKFW